MRRRYFVLDSENQFRKASQAVIEGLWSGQRTADQLQIPLGSVLRILTVLCDDDLIAKGCYVLRLELAEGRITEASHRAACEAVVLNSDWGPHHPAVQYHFEGWPTDWQRQIAIAFDAHPQQLSQIGVGGPLPISEVVGISIRESLRYFA